MAILAEEERDCIRRSVLCWLATSAKTGQPNVSPKELFYAKEDDSIIVANVASPGTSKNIAQNPRVAISVVDIYVQKGFQFHGHASIITEENSPWEDYAAPLIEMTKGNFPFHEIFKIVVDKKKRILAPSYVFYPETTEEDQINAAIENYKGRIKGN